MSDSLDFYQDVIVHDPRFTSNLRCFSMELLEPVTRAAVSAIMKDALVEYGWTTLVFETYRSQMRQTQLFNIGATQLRVVGVHSFGLAADIVKSLRGQPSWDGDFSWLATLAKRHGLISGQAWDGTPNPPDSFTDACHVQRIRVDEQPSLFNGTWYPEVDYNPYPPAPVVETA